VKSKPIAEANAMERRINPVFRALNTPLTLLGVERRLFFFALVMGAAVFNLQFRGNLVSL
jgi:hypothetical protein